MGATLAKAIIIDANGKVPRRPSLERYDTRRITFDAQSSCHLEVQIVNDSRNENDRRREVATNRCALRALGVDGDVPLAQAMANAGLSGRVVLATNVA